MSDALSQAYKDMHAKEQEARTFLQLLDEKTGKQMSQEDKEKAPKGLRFNAGKRRWSLVHFKSLEPMIEVLEFGAKKYTAHNWKKGLSKTEILESIQRHLAKMIDGEENDSETGISHMGHIQCNTMFYNYMVDNNLGE